MLWQNVNQSMPVIYDRKGNLIGDQTPKFFEESQPVDNYNIPGVDLDGNVSHKITGVDMADETNDNHSDTIEE